MLIYGACQIGMHVNADDMGIHTLIAVNEYQAKLLKSKENGNVATNDEPVSLSSLGDRL